MESMARTELSAFRGESHLDSMLPEWSRKELTTGVSICLLIKFQFN